MKELIITELHSPGILYFQHMYSALYINISQQVFAVKLTKLAIPNLKKIIRNHPGLISC